MAIWDTLKKEFDKAGQVAQGALDGYAVFRAKGAGAELEPERYASLAANIMTAEAEIARLEAQIESLKTTRAAST